MSSSTQKVQNLLQWIEAQGGYVHPSVVPELDPSTGLSAFAQADIDKDERLISCPFNLAVTPELAGEAICAIESLKEDELVWLAGTSRAGEKWNDRMRIGAYIGLHWVRTDEEGEESLPSSLRHWPYINSLPPAPDLTTPLYFTEPELDLLRGTNLHGAVMDRKAEWKEEWAAMNAVLKKDGLTWDRYLLTATYLSSRAFPSKLLRLPDTGSSTTSAIQTSDEEDSHPVLLPGVDLFNHARGQPIVWLSSETPSTSHGSTKTISLVTPAAHSKGAQLFNNYGPKPNEELLLGYGFVIDDNPDDVVALKLGSQKASGTVTERLTKAELDPTKRFLLRRDGKLDPDLMSVLRILLSPDYPVEEEEIDSEDEHALHAQEEKSMQLELDVLGTLGQMLDDKLEKLEQASPGEGEVRDEVRTMVEVYRKGQVEIVSTAMEKIEERIRRLEGLMDQGMGGCACCT
ncbi:uncharacterized protein MKK02DRAFT_36002 [Dioszegia hungarica]|uniref:SET domain-containing protein n=1 Tax=Dioszegia hungarica TaxID=4972 RepID=A0AA38HFG7_9TREE|nr:uncharacterized protein MKK02DRAFT_36002 [Dioszegia hungarica]KAI9638021.1 hypothetical protein MKK02DRAFT_36002 [Dioszegia hungarica]